ASHPLRVMTAARPGGMVVAWRGAAAKGVRWPTNATRASVHAAATRPTEAARAWRSVGSASSGCVSWRRRSGRRPPGRCCRPAASASLGGRQAALQRRAATVLQPLDAKGYLVLHDITLPGWPASLEHLVVGATGVWVIESWRRRLPTLRKGASPWRANGGAA